MTTTAFTKLDAGVDDFMKKMDDKNCVRELYDSATKDFETAKKVTIALMIISCIAISSELTLAIIKFKFVSFRNDWDFFV